MNKAISTLVKALNQLNKSKTSSYDTTATVTRVEGDTVYVHIPGGVDETPANKTIDAKVGQTVQVRISNNQAFLVGNSSAPPTDDYTAIKAYTVASNTSSDLTNFKNSVVTDSTIANSIVLNSNVVNSTINDAIISQSEIVESHIYNSTLEDFTYVDGWISDFSVYFAHIVDGVIDNATISYADVNDLDAHYAHITDGVIDNAKIGYADVNDLNANFAHISNGVIDNATISYAHVDDLDTYYARISTLEANYAHITNGVIDNAKIGYADVDDLDVNYAKIDMANVNNAWLNNGVIVNGAISDAMINSVSANKLTAGTIDASKINVANLRAKNLIVERLNGQPILGGLETVKPNSSGYSSKNPSSEGWYEYVNGNFAASTDTAVDPDKVYYKDANQVALYDQTYIDGLESDLNQRIDGLFETYTGTEIPTLNNYPAADWSASEMDTHIGDVYFVVGPSISVLEENESEVLEESDSSIVLEETNGEEEGYTYRFAKDSNGVYSWILIKDTAITRVLQDLVDIENEIDGIKLFESTTERWATNTNEELSSVAIRTTTLETQMGTKVESSVVSELSDTVDEHTASITSMSTTLESKADGSTVETLSNTVNSIQQTTSSNVLKLSNLTTYLGVAEDGSTDFPVLEEGGEEVLEENESIVLEDSWRDVVYKLSQLSQTLDGFKSTVIADYATSDRVSQAESDIIQNADNIELKVSKDGVISSINQSPESILISADKVNIQGVATFLADDYDFQTAADVIAATSSLVTSVTTKDQYYLSTSDTIATGDTRWHDTVPTWGTDTYIWTRVATTKTTANGSTTTYSTEVYDRALTTALSTALSAQESADSAAASVVTTKQYYLSTSDTIATGDTRWHDTVPTWTSNTYIWTRYKIVTTPVSGTATTSYSPSEGGIYDKALTTALSTGASAYTLADNAATKADAVFEEQTIYKQAVSGTATMAAYPSSATTDTSYWVTATGESVSSDTTGQTPVWTTKRPTYRSNYPVLFVAKQRKTVSGSITCTTPTKDDTTTIIDGGHITTGSIDASLITTNKITSAQIETVGGWHIDDLYGIYTAGKTSGSATVDGMLLQNDGSIYAGSYPYVLDESGNTVLDESGASVVEEGGNCPFVVDKYGNLTANSATIRGTIYATAGYISDNVVIGGTTAAGLKTQLDNAIAKVEKSINNDANQYITRISGYNGITVHNYNDFKNFANVNSDGLTVYKNLVDVAHFGSTVRVGQTGSGYTTLASTGMDVWYSTTQLAHIGYGSGNNDSGGTSPGPYYTFGTRNSSNSVGNLSLAEGYLVTASGCTSHAEGWQVIASGFTSHAEGTKSTASGKDSHAEGYHTTASGTGSHAGGASTIAQRAYQTVIGMCNKLDTQGENVNSIGKYAFIVGNGTDETDSARSNAFAVDWSGDIEVAGGVYAHGHSNAIGSYMDGFYNASSRDIGVQHNATTSSYQADFVQLTAGTWLILYGAAFAANATGWRQVALSTVTSASNLSPNRYDSLEYPGQGSQQHKIHCQRIVRLTADAKYYLYISHNAGETLTVYPYITAVLIT